MGDVPDRMRQAFPPYYYVFVIEIVNIYTSEHAVTFCIPHVFLVTRLAWVNIEF